MKHYFRVWKEGTPEPAQSKVAVSRIWEKPPNEHAEKEAAEHAVVRYLDDQIEDAEEGDIYFARMDKSKNVYPVEVEEVEIERTYYVYAEDPE